MLKIAYRNTPLKVLRRMPSKTARRIRDGIEVAARNPEDPGLDIKPLTNRPGFRLRVGKWRVIFEMDGKTLDVLTIETRGDVYKPRKRR